MAVQALIPVDEYLGSIYEPDCDFIDGRLEERNVGSRKHARLQARLAAYLLGRYASAGFEVFSEMRIQVGPTRFRIPGLCVTIGDPGEDVFTTPPHLCIEILSPEDRMSRVEIRINDFLQMGVNAVWVLDPETRQAYVATAQHGLQQVTSDTIRSGSPVIEVPLSEIFPSE